jgi:predicted nucleic acid-binding protein
MVLCDTNVLIEALKKNPSAIQSLEEIGLDSVAVSVITVMELYYGALNKAELMKIKRHLSSVQIVHIDEEISATGATLIERYAKSHGLMIPDALIAATALGRDLQLFTENRGDLRVPAQG